METGIGQVGSDKANAIHEFIDSETGVHYLIYSDRDDYAGMGGITPRLNRDGSIMIDSKITED